MRQLNEKAAAYYRTGGTVTGPGIVLADGLEAAVGDVVVTRKNNSKYVVEDSDGNTSGRVKNGDLWTVAAIGDDGSLRLRNNISGGQVTVAADYITDNVQLGYATTVHRSQGMTVGSCHVLAGANMDRQSLYVALTRGKHANIVYAANDELPDWDFEHRPDEHPGAIGLLAKIIARDGSQRTVHQMIEDEQRKAASWSKIVDIYMLAVGGAVRGLHRTAPGPDSHRRAVRLGAQPRRVGSDRHLRRPIGNLRLGHRDSAARGRRRDELRRQSRPDRHRDQLPPARSSPAP